jgi:hypothetical protein
MGVFIRASCEQSLASVAVQHDLLPVVQAKNRGLFAYSLRLKADCLETMHKSARIYSNSTRKRQLMGAPTFS